MEEALNKLKQFESVLKKFIIDTYGAYLPQDRVDALNQGIYATSELLEGRTNEEIRGTIARRMFDELIDMNCFKEIMVEGVLLPLPYGEDLERSLIEYYTQELASKYNFKVNEIDGLSEDLETIKLLNEKLGGTLNSHAFSEDAMKLLNAASIEELVKKYDEEAIDKYFNQVQVIAGDNKAPEEENELMKQSTERQDSLQIVWLDEKKHIKYIDQDGKVHLINIDKMPQVEDFYNSKLANLKPDEKLDPEAFFSELKTYADELELQSTKDVKKDELNSEQVDMLEFIAASPELQQGRKDDIVTHNNDMNIHVIESTNDIVTTQDKQDHVEADIVLNGQAQAQTSTSQEMNNISSELVSKEEFEALKRRFDSGEQLTLEELSQLKRAIFVYNLETPKEELSEEEVQAVEKPIALKQNYQNAAFTINELAMYIVLLTLFLTSLIAIFLLK